MNEDLSSSSKCNGSNGNSKNEKKSQPTAGSKQPLIPLSLFMDRSFVTGTLVIIVFYIANPVFVFVLTYYLQKGLGFPSLNSGLTFLPMGVGIIISSLLSPKIVPKLKTGILKIGTIILIIGYGLLVITAHQAEILLQWSQLLTYMFILGIGLGFVIVPLINIIISRAKVENVATASGVLNTMIAVGNAMGIALIGSLFFGMIGVGAISATSHIKIHSNNANEVIKIHHYTDALVNSTLCTIALVIVTFFLIFLLPSKHPKEQSNKQKN